MPYFIAIAHTSYIGSFRGDWSVIPEVLGTSQKYAQANCLAPVGKHACWPQEPPIYVSYGGPIDQVRTQRVQEQVQA